jgi:hypothetical protein
MSIAVSAINRANTCIGGTRAVTLIEVRTEMLPPARPEHNIFHSLMRFSNGSQGLPAPRKCINKKKNFNGINNLFCTNRKIFFSPTTE